MCLASLSNYSEIWPAPREKSFWAALPLGWLITACIDAPTLIFRDDDLFAAGRLRDAMDEQGRRVLAARVAIVKHVDGAKQDMGKAVRRLQSLHRRLVFLAVGYDAPIIARRGHRAMYAFADYYFELSGCAIH